MVKWAHGAAIITRSRRHYSFYIARYLKCAEGETVLNVASIKQRSLYESGNNHLVMVHSFLFTYGGLDLLYFTLKIG